jgi:broad specificity phosphatase PhoE
MHLVRHAEVENPDNILYGRLSGFVLSERGRLQAEELGAYFSQRKIAAVYSSPLERAIETATAIARPHALKVIEEADIIESETRLQGRPGDSRLFRNPLRLRHFINPLRPSWGESYASTGSRMTEAIFRMREKHPGEEVVAVSHMTPIVVARMRIENRRGPAWSAGLPCAKASVATITFDGDKYLGTDYLDVGSRVP